MARGPVANVEIGCEVKILAKAMIKQIDRVVGDLAKQAVEFRRSNHSAICVGIVGINHSDQYTSYEGRRAFTTTGAGSYLHPVQEALKAEERLLQQVKSDFDELVILRFRASNKRPYPFDWVDAEGTSQDYGAALVRILSEYGRRFP